MAVNKSRAGATLLAGALALFCAPIGWTQAPERPEAQRQLQERFSAAGIEAGAPFPEVDVFDAEGNPFNTRSLNGKYTVIVNGCLT